MSVRKIYEHITDGKHWGIRTDMLPGEDTVQFTESF
jgi:hypothetical protein